ncbi:MAG: agmatine deiminase family protein [Bryobacteraceae bacterium]|nr:agmatine deiminase family protein [Bryobacteraceae bacterium]MDW8377762.1 agmatine deiminase family protein [Bryobacterales bacterium]
MPARPATPAALGYRMPAEWEPHEATWLAWPHERSDWPGKFATIPWVYGEVVRYLSQVEQVRILVGDLAMERQARRVLQKSGGNLQRVEFFHCPTDRSWTRDSCPIFVRNAAGALAMTHWRFNGWAKYGNYARDAAIPIFLRKRLRLPYFKPMLGSRHVVLEGGSIDVNGAGVLMTTEECLLSPVQARNPTLTRQQIEEVLQQYLGVEEILWLRNGIAGDDTHGHIDDLARFVNPSTIVIAAERDRSEVNYPALAENLRLLQATKRFHVAKLPMPKPVYFDGQRLPASYANFYIANELVLVPVFNDPNDRRALSLLARLMPDREIIPIYAGDLVLGLGTLHCMTQQQPQADGRGSHGASSQQNANQGTE